MAILGWQMTIDLHENEGEVVAHLLLSRPRQASDRDPAPELFGVSDTPDIDEMQAALVAGIADQGRLLREVGDVIAGYLYPALDKYLSRPPDPDVVVMGREPAPREG